MYREDPTYIELEKLIKAAGVKISYIGKFLMILLMGRYGQEQTRKAWKS